MEKPVMNLETKEAINVIKNNPKMMEFIRSGNEPIYYVSMFYGDHFNHIDNKLVISWELVDQALSEVR